MEPTDLIALTADIVAAQVSNNAVPSGELPELIASVHAALAKTGTVEVSEAARAEPAVSIRASIKPDYLVCLEDGKKLKMLKRYLRTNYDMSPEDYRAKWGLSRDYPMVAPAYAETRRGLAHAIGLGRKKVASIAAPIVENVDKAVASAIAPAPKKRGRPAKASIEKLVVAKAVKTPRGIAAAKAAAQAHLGTQSETPAVAKPDA